MEMFVNPKKRAFYDAETGEKTCAKCSKKRLVSEFYRNSQTTDGWHSWCKSCFKEGNKRSTEKKYGSFEGRIKTFLRTCATSAKKRGHEFSLSADNLREMWETQYGLCAYTGIAMTTQPNLPHSVSVERVDNNIGYTEANTVLVCKAVNAMKSDLDAELFYDMCKSVVNWLGNEERELDVEFVKHGG
jgi:hypothetical protein